MAVVIKMSTKHTVFRRQCEVMIQKLSKLHDHVGVASVWLVFVGMVLL